MLEAIAGMRPETGGDVVLGGRSIGKSTVAQRRAAGLAYIPEDRYAEGTAPGLSVAENLAATHLRPPVARFGWVSSRGARSFAQRLIRRFDVRGATPDTPVSALSGGNMQKVVIAREFEAEPRLLMVSQPTRGVDVGAMEFVHNALVAARDRGAGVLLSSADLNEVMSLSDRLLVMYRGRIVASFTQEDMTETAVGLAMAGAHVDERTVAEAEAEHEKIVEQVATHEQVPQEPAGAPGGPQPAASPDDDNAAPLAPVLTDETAAAEPPAGPVRDGASAAAAAANERPAGPSRAREVATKTVRNSVQPIVAVVLSLLVGMVIILALGDDPFAAYKELFFSSWQTPQGFGGLVAQLIPLLVLSSAVIVSFRAGFFNIGGEGQLYVGAFAGAWVGFTFPSVPGPLLIVLMFLAAFAAGGVWGLIPGALLAYWRVDIIVTTLMMSSIAVLLTAYLVTGPFKDPAAGLAGSPKVPDDTLLPVFSPEYGVGLDLVIGLVVIVVLGLVLTRSVWGLKIRELGQMNRFAEYTGVNSRRMILQVMLVSGAVAGLAGVIFVLGPNGGRFLQTFSPGYGFLGITVALLARLNPWAAIIAAVFYANMMAGSNSMQVNTNVPYPLVNVLQGLIILFITATVLLGRRRRAVREAARGGRVPGAGGRRLRRGHHAHRVRLCHSRADHPGGGGPLVNVVHQILTATTLAVIFIKVAPLLLAVHRRRAHAAGQHPQHRPRGHDAHRRLHRGGRRLRTHNSAARAASLAAGPALVLALIYAVATLLPRPTSSWSASASTCSRPACPCSCSRSCTAIPASRRRRPTSPCPASRWDRYAASRRSARRSPTRPRWSGWPCSACRSTPMSCTGRGWECTCGAVGEDEAAAEAAASG